MMRTITIYCNYITVSPIKMSFNLKSWITNYHQLNQDERKTSMMVGSICSGNLYEYNALTF